MTVTVTVTVTVTAIGTFRIQFHFEYPHCSTARDVALYCRVEFIGTDSSCSSEDIYSIVSSDVTRVLFLAPRSFIPEPIIPPSSGSIQQIDGITTLTKKKPELTYCRLFFATHTDCCTLVATALVESELSSCGKCPHLVCTTVFFPGCSTSVVSTNTSCTAPSAILLPSRLFSAKRLP